MWFARFTFTFEDEEPVGPLIRYQVVPSFVIGLVDGDSFTIHNKPTLPKHRQFGLVSFLMVSIVLVDTKRLIRVVNVTKLIVNSNRFDLSSSRKGTEPSDHFELRFPI